MGYGWEQVHDEAEKLEHVVSDLFVERIDAYLGYPDKDPHGEVIPDAKGFRSRELDICLLRAEPGEYVIRKVTNDQPEFLAYLEKQALTPGASFVLLEKAPFQGPLKLILAGRKLPQYLGLEAAKDIHVLPVGLSRAESIRVPSGVGRRPLHFLKDVSGRRDAAPPGRKENRCVRSTRRPQ